MSSRRFSFFPKKVKAPEPMLLPAGTPLITPYGAGVVDSIAGGIYKINLSWHLAQGQPAVLHANAADVECGTIANSAGTFIHRYRPAASRKLAAGAPITTPFGAGVVKSLSADGGQYAIALDWTLAQGQHALLHACAADVESGEGTASSTYGFAHEHTEEKTSELAPGTPSEWRLRRGCAPPIIPRAIRPATHPPPPPMLSQSPDPLRQRPGAQSRRRHLRHRAQVAPGAGPVRAAARGAGRRGER
jgi:hypothetical protein